MKSVLEMDPIEVWLSQKNMAITCMVVREDESTYRISVGSLSMRGAQRHITTRLASAGYTPVGRWGVETAGETVRRFK